MKRLPRSILNRPLPYFATSTMFVLALFLIIRNPINYNGNAKWVTGTLSRLPDWLSIVSFPLTIMGFYFAIAEIINASTIAEEAKRASEKAEKSIFKFISAKELSTAISQIELMKELHRDRKFQKSLGLYDNSVKVLSYIKSIDGIDDLDRTSIQQAMVAIRIIERKVESYDKKYARVDSEDISKFNESIDEHLDSLRDIAHKLEKEVMKSEQSPARSG